MRNNQNDNDCAEKSRLSAYHDAMEKHNYAEQKNPSWKEVLLGIRYRF